MMPGASGLQRRAFDAGLGADLLDNLAHQRFGVTPAPLTRQRADGVDTNQAGGDHDGGGGDGHSVGVADKTSKRAMPGTFRAVDFAADRPRNVERNGRNVRKS